MSRDEHLAWCKQRALEYVDAGDLNQALTSMLSDMTKHDETRASADKLGPMAMGMLMIGALSTPHDMRRFINGFN